MKQTMKKLLAVLTLTAALPLSAQVSNSASEINAQTSATRGAIDNVLERMVRTRIETPFRATDYFAQRKTFEQKLENAFKNFEDNLTKVIFPRVQFFMDQYNQIVNSTDIAHLQKEQLLVQMRTRLGHEMRVLSTEYQKQIAEVFAFDSALAVQLELLKTTGHYCGNTPADKVSLEVPFRLNLNGRRLGRDQKLILKSASLNHEITQWTVNGTKIGIVARAFDNGCSRRFYDYDVDFNEIPYGIFVSMVMTGRSSELYSLQKGSCQSQVCISLRSNDLLMANNQIKNGIDRDLTFTLADGTETTLQGLKRDLLFSNKLLTNTTYPENLPFDL